MKKDRIKTSGPAEGLQNPFAKLEVTGLPPADLPSPGAGSPVGPGPGRSARRGAASPKLGRVVLRREKAHRGGKTVVVVDDFDSCLSSQFIESLARRLRQALGCGGAVKDRTIEIQGDQPAKVCALLEQEGFRVAGVRS